MPVTRTGSTTRTNEARATEATLTRVYAELSGLTQSVSNLATALLEQGHPDDYPNAAADQKLAAAVAHLSTIADSLAELTVEVSGAVTVQNFPAEQTVDGTVDVGNWPPVQPVGGTVDVGNFPSFPAVQTVDGEVTVGNLPASQTVDGVVEVSNLLAVQPVTGAVSVDNLPSSQTVDGTVDVGNWPSSQPVEGTVDVGNFPAQQDVSVVKARTLFDYDTRTDGNPVYMGQAPQGTALSDGGWQVLRFTYDSSSRATDIQVLSGVWDDRASLSWS